MRQIAFYILNYHMIVILLFREKGMMGMKMVRLLIQVRAPIKTKLDVLREQGTTASGFIRHLLEAHFKQAPVMGRKGR